MKYFNKYASVKMLIVSLFMSVLFLASCEKYLDEKSDKRLAELKTLEDLQALLDDGESMNIGTPSYGEASADDYYLTMDAYNSLDDLQKSAYVWQYHETLFANDWSNNYRAIYPANYCLTTVNKIQRTPSIANKWDNVKGSALFHRAYRYLNLIWEYGNAYDETSSISDLGIVLRLNDDPTELSNRATVKECYDRIIEDAKAAVELLPDFPEHVMRPSKAAAYGLLARTYLSMRQYSKAFDYANLSLNIKNDILDYNDPSLVDQTSLSPFQPFNKEIIFFSTQSNNFYSKHPSYGLIDSTLFAEYNDMDKRRQVFFLADNGKNTFKGNYHTDFYTYFSGIATDEMLVTRAECNARENRVAEAMSDLNSLLLNRWESGSFTPFVVNTQQEALQIILIERRKELLMRGLRWIDIKRLNKEGANIILKRDVSQIFTLPPNDSRYALPLPKDIIELTGMPQNPGW